MEPTVKKNEEKSQFELYLGDQMIGLMTYWQDEDSNVREFPHAEVDPAHQGKGLAGRLVGEGLKATREEGLKVLPLCPYIAMYMQRHPEYLDLLAE